MTLGERIIILRNKQDLSQESLAQLLDLSIETIQQIEQNVLEPNLDSLNKLSKIFNVSLDYLITGIEFNQNKNEKSSNYNYRALDREDILILILLILSIALFVGTFIYSLINPMYYNQSISFVWWYVRIWVSAGTFFRILVLISIIGIVITTKKFLKRGKNNEKH
jgi:transcriptional regulator with XRE-family HTH domain